MLCSRTSPITKKAEYLQMINLAAGAQIVSYFEGGYATPGQPSPQFRKHELEDWWNITRREPRQFCVVNGQYFTNKTLVPVGNRWQYALTTHAYLSFPVKNAGFIVGSGADVTTQANLYAFSWNGSGASYGGRYYGRLNDFWSAAANLSLSNGVVGTGVLFESGSIARTYIGSVAGNPSMVAIYSTPKATAQQAKDVLDAASIYSVVQLDGGDSGAIRCGTSWYNPHGRAVPHVLLTLAAPK